MALTVDDLNAVRAQWEEWTAGAGFTLSMEVMAGAFSASMVSSDQPMARLEVDSRHVLVEIRTSGHRVVFSQRVPYDAAALRASVSVPARTIAEHQERLAGGDG